MAINIKPEDVDAHYNLGGVLLKMQEAEKAISHLKIAIKLKPDYADAHHNLKIALLRSKAKDGVVSH